MAAYSSFGTTLKIGATGAGGAYTAPTNAVGEVTSLNIDGIKLNAIDVTGLTDRFRKFVPGLIDSGSVSLDVNFDSDDTNGQKIMVQLLDNTAATTAPSARSFLVQYGDANNKIATFAFVGIVTDISWKGPLDAVVGASIQIKVTGSITYADVL